MPSAPDAGVGGSAAAVLSFPADVPVSQLATAPEAAGVEALTN